MNKLNILFWIFPNEHKSVGFQSEVEIIPLVDVEQWRNVTLLKISGFHRRSMILKNWSEILKDFFTSNSDPAWKSFRTVVNADNNETLFTWFNKSIRN